MAIVHIRDLGGGISEVFINGIDYSMEVYAGTLKLVEVKSDEGEDAASAIGLQLTLAVTQLHLNDERDVFGGLCHCCGIKGLLAVDERVQNMTGGA